MNPRNIILLFLAFLIGVGALYGFLVGFGLAPVPTKAPEASAPSTATPVATSIVRPPSTSPILEQSPSTAPPDIPDIPEDDDESKWTVNEDRTLTRNERRVVTDACRKKHPGDFHAMRKCAHAMRDDIKQNDPAPADTASPDVELGPSW